MQQSFLNETRLNANEGLEKLNKHVRRFGKMVRTFVKFFVAFFLLSVFNLCLELFTKHTHLLSLNSVRLFEESLRVFINQNLVAFVSLVSENNLFAAIAVAFACVFGCACIAQFIVSAQSNDDCDNQVKERKQFKQETVSASCVVAYKQKVCFLS